MRGSGSVFDGEIEDEDIRILVLFKNGSHYKNISCCPSDAQTL